MAFLLPMTFWLQFVVSQLTFLVLLHVLLGLVGLLFILDFPLKKPGLKTILALVAVVAITVGIIYARTRFRLPHPADESNPVVEEIIDEI